jgi:competence protein ComEC
LVALAVVWALNVRQPDVLVADGGHAFAVRTADGLAIMKTGNDAFAVRAWLAADGDQRTPRDATLSNGFSCDPAGCIARLRDGALVSVVLAAAAFEEDCARAALVLSARTAPPYCRATVVDRTIWQHAGALALTRTATGFAIEAARPANQDRPWARARGGEGSAAPIPPAPSRPTPRDATPRPEDLGPED